MTEPALEELLLSSRAKILGFIQSKVSDPDLAEDILQESLLRALTTASELRDEEKLVSWFYGIVRNACMDAYRRGHRSAKYLEAYAREREGELNEQDQAVLCACLRELVPALKPEYAELIEALELGNETSEGAAARMGITPNNLKVRRHRARGQLRQRLQEVCRLCAEHGCLDCTCQRAH